MKKPFTINFVHFCVLYRTYRPPLYVNDLAVPFVHISVGAKLMTAPLFKRLRLQIPLIEKRVVK